MRAASVLVVCGLALASSAAPAFAKDHEAKSGKPAARRGIVHVRKVAVAEFDAPSESHARAAVLTQLSDQDDVEVIGLDDINFAAKRFKVGTDTAAGRKRISEELGVEAWIDGRVDATAAHLTLTKADGTPITQADVKAPTAKVLDALAGERMWAAMGPLLSPREESRRKLLAETERAHQKIEARAQELEHQRTLAKQAAEHVKSMAAQAEHQRQQKLEAARALATVKRVAVLAELSRQVQLVQTHRAEQLAERKRAEDAQARAQQQAAKAQQLAVAAPSQETGAYLPAAAAGAAPAQETGGYAPRASKPYAARGSGYAASGGYTAGSAQPASGWQNAAPAPADTSGVSPATQRWLQQQGTYLGQPAANQPPPTQAAPSLVPARPTGYAANSGVSPATQKWLAQQQLH